MSAFEPGSAAAVAATWVAAIVTLVVLGSLFGERRLFAWSQHLLAGLATGFLAVIVIADVLLPRLVTPIVEDPVARPELWFGVGLAAVTAAAPWLPRPMAAIPASIAIGALAAFALGGAVLGTLLPQLDAAIARPGTSVAATVGSAVAAVITGLVLIGFLHGVPRGRAFTLVTDTGRWLLLAGLGGWLGFLLLSRAVLLVERIGFLLGDWLGIGR
jgi:hypothetical protein